MVKGHPLVIIGSDRTLFTVNVSESFTVPQTVAITSPTAQYQPSGVAGTFNTQRPTAGGQLLLAFTDGAGPNNASELEVELNPGDVVALSAIASGATNVSVNGSVIYTITATTAASVVGWYA